MIVGALCATFLAGQELQESSKGATQEPKVSNRVEYMTDIVHGLNFLEGQSVNKIGSRFTLVSGFEALGFLDTKLLGLRAGIPVTIKGFTLIPSVLTVYNTQDGGFSPGFAIRTENEFWGNRIYTQSFMGWYHRNEHGKDPWVLVLDPAEVTFKVLPGRLKEFQMGVSLEKWNGERIWGPIFGHPVGKGLELTFQVIPKGSTFQEYSTHEGAHPDAHAGDILWRVGFVWKPKHNH